MVDEYALWYDRHLDPEWQDLLLAPPNAAGEQVPWAYVLPKDPRGSARHGPVLCQDDVSQRRQHHPHPSLRQSDPARGADRRAGSRGPGRSDRRGDGLSRRDRAHRAVSDLLRRRADHRPAHAPRPEGAGVAKARARDRCRDRRPRQARHAHEPGLCRGRLCRRTLSASRSAAIRPALSCRSTRPGLPPCAARSRRATANPFVSPLSSRYDELDGQMWLDDVFIPWERVFFVDPSPEAIPRWLRWHHLYGWLAKAEFTLGLGLALTHAMGLKEHEPTIEYLVDLIVRGADRAQLPDRGRARSRVHPGRLLLPQSRPSRRRGHRALQGPPADVRDPADPARLLARRRPDRPRSRGARDGGGAREIVRRRRLHRAAARGATATRLGPCLVGARWP